MAKDPKDPDEGDSEAHPPDPEGAGDLEQDRRAAHDRLTVLEAALHELVRKLGGGNWRVTTDLVDHTVQRIENRILHATRPLPENLIAFATTILRNLLRKGPPRRLRRDGIEPLAEGVEIAARDRLEADRHLPSIAELHQLIETTASGIVTEDEHTALRSILGAESHHKAAKAAGMTERDLRNRKDRAVKKIRKFLERLRPPPPFEG